MLKNTINRQSGNIGSCTENCSDTTDRAAVVQDTLDRTGQSFACCDRTIQDQDVLVLPRMKTDIIEVMEACVNGTLDQVDLEFEDNAAVCVVLASDGYPVKYEKGIPMHGFENFKDKEGYYCFHAGTKFKDGEIVTNGGRVLGVTATGKDLKEARKNAYEATDWIQFANKYMRHDIGKAIDEA